MSKNRFYHDETLGNLYIVQIILYIVSVSLLYVYVCMYILCTLFILRCMFKYFFFWNFFRNIEKWSSDTLITLSDLLIVLNPDQLNCIPAMSRVNSADIIQTHYADEIEWLSHNIPFYKV